MIAMTFEDILRATLLPALREAVREEMRAIVGERRSTEPGDMLPVEEAAAIASVHPETMRKWIKRGFLPRHKAGRELRVMRSELDRFLTSGAPPDERSAEDVASNILGRKKGT